MNPLDDHPRVRVWVYTAFWLVALVQGALNVAYLAAGDIPAWLEVANAVVPFVGGYIGYTARRNTPPPDPGPSVADRVAPYMRP